jgi:hypothetical protein
MESHIELVSETRKEWVAPELKKVDVEEITASGNGSTTEGFSGAS